MPRKTDDTPINPAYFQRQVAKDVSEAELQEWVIEAMRARGYLVFHPRVSRNSEPGFPDLVAAKRGCVTLFIECKKEKGKLTPGRMAPRSNRWLPGQDEWAEVLDNRADVRYLLIRPWDWLSGEIGKELRGEA